MQQYSLIQTIAIWAIPVLFAITLHEVAHGWVASWFGDQTARLSGRLTVNPIKHIDPIGTIAVPLLLFTFSHFIFGWAKPVPVDPRNFHHPRRDIALVAAAGPISNLLMALFWGGIARLGLYLYSTDNFWFGEPLRLMGEAGILINVVLAVLNFIPLPPLDGGKVFASLLPRSVGWYLYRIEPYSFFILILLMVTGILSRVMYPIVAMLNDQIMGLFGLF